MVLSCRLFILTTLLHSLSIAKSISVEEDYIAEQGLCIQEDGSSAGDPVLLSSSFIFPFEQAHVDGCKALCSELEGVTACQISSGGTLDMRGCYGFTGPAYRSTGEIDFYASCFLPPNSVCPERALKKFDVAEQTGRCLSPDGSVQDEGRILIEAGSFASPAEKQRCLDMCACMDGVTGCEVYNDPFGPREKLGCYAHTSELKPVTMDERSGYCWNAVESTCPERMSAEMFGREKWGKCVLEDGTEQLEGMVLLEMGDFETDEDKERCLALCACAEGVTACEMSYGTEASGCFAHTRKVSRGSGPQEGKHKNKSCFITPLQVCPMEAEEEFQEKRRGRCLNPFGEEPKEGVLLLKEGDFGNDDSKKFCKEMCACVPGVTACETRAGNKGGCYAHTTPVTSSNDAGDPECWISYTQPYCTGPTANLWGNSHIESFGEVKHDCQTSGEHTLFQSKDGKIKMNAIFAPLHDGVSVARHVAFVGDDLLPTIEAYVPEVADELGNCPYTFLVGQEKLEVPDILNYFDEDLVKVFHYGPDANVIYFKRYGIRLDLTTSSNGGFCQIGLNACVSPGKLGGATEVEGIFGNPDSMTDNDWPLLEGGYQDIPTDPFQRYRESTAWCEDNWRVNTPSDSLFLESTYDLYDAPSSFDVDGFFDFLAGDDDFDSVCDGDLSCGSDLLAGGAEAATNNGLLKIDLEMLAALPAREVKQGILSVNAPGFSILPTTRNPEIGLVENRRLRMASELAE